MAWFKALRIIKFLVEEYQKWEKKRNTKKELKRIDDAFNNEDIHRINRVFNRLPDDSKGKQDV